MIERALFALPAERVSFTLTAHDGYWDLSTNVQFGFSLKDRYTRAYEGLTTHEAADVLGAAMDSYRPGSNPRG